MSADVKITNIDLGFKLLEAKKDFGQLFLFTGKFAQYVFRPLLIEEVETVQSMAYIIEEYIIDEWVISKSIISGNSSLLLDKEPAGLVPAIAGSILSKSVPGSVSDMSKLLEEGRKNKEAVANVIDSILRQAIYKDGSSPKKLTYRQQMGMLPIAEDILQRKIEITDPDKLPKNMKNKPMDPKLVALLSAQYADKPDFKKDNSELKGV